MDWSGMLPEVLAIIAQKQIVFYEDYHSFAGVCKSWHLAAIEAAKKHKFPNGPPSRFPSLMLSQKSEDKEFRELLLLSNKGNHKKSIRKIRLPQIYDKAFMIPCGWLVTVGENHASQLIHPLSFETLNLPKVDTIRPKFFSYSNWDDDVRKLLLLTNNSQSSLVLPLVVVLWGTSRLLRFCQPGDSKWSHVRMGWNPMIYDFTYYNGKVYCFDYIDHIRAWDVHVNDPSILVDVSFMPKDLYHEPSLHEAVYLIGLDDDERKRLLVVIRKTQIDENYDKKKRFLVFAYDLENKEWSKVKDFGTKALFVGDASFWIEEDTTGVIKGNCIYFTDEVNYVYGYKENRKVGDMGIYHMSDETIEPHFPGESLNRVTPQIWLQSM